MNKVPVIQGANPSQWVCIGRLILAGNRILSYRSLGNCYALTLKNELGITYRALLLEEGKLHQEFYPHSEQASHL